MATKYLVNTTLSTVAQVDTLTVGGTIEAGDKFKITLTDETGTTATLSVSATTTVIATTCTEIAAAFNASVDPRFTPITAAAGATTVTLTADSAGVPFYCTVETTESNDAAADAQTFVRAATTANRGPYDWNTAANWSDLAVPVSTDNVIIDGRQTGAILYGLNQAAVALTSLRRYQTAYAVGTAVAALRIRPGTCNINEPPTDGSIPTPAFTNLDTGTSAAATVSVWGSNSSGSSGIEPVCISGGHASNKLYVYAGIVGLGTALPSDAPNYPIITAKGRAARLIIASGCTAPTTLEIKEQATVTLRVGATTIDLGPNSLLVHEGSGTVGTGNLDGRAVLNGTGTWTAVHGEDNCEIDTTQTGNARTFTAFTLYGEGRLKTDLNSTYTAGIALRRGASAERIITPDNLTVSLAA